MDGPAPTLVEAGLWFCFAQGEPLLNSRQEAKTLQHSLAFN